MILLYFENGRLGNQLFQYSALKTMKRNDILLLFGFRSLEKTFEGIDAYFFGDRNSVLGRIFTKLFVLFFDIISRRLRLINTICETNSNGEVGVERRRGLFFGITYCSSGFFQGEKFFKSENICDLKIKKNIIDRAKEKIKEIKADNKTKIFIHIRRGDYIKYPNPEKPAVVPASWYKKMMMETRLLTCNPFFIICTDDTPYAIEMFGDSLDVFISNGEKEEFDFALMSECDGGILSASSFAWWAAYFIHLRNPKALFFAPKYWIGHASNIWSPESIETPWITYKNV